MNVFSHRNNSQIARNCFLRFGVELLTFAANYANGRKTDIFPSSDRQSAIADLVAVAADIERPIFLPIARQARLSLETSQGASSIQQPPSQSL